MHDTSKRLDRLILDQAALLSELDRFIDSIEGKRSSRTRTVKASNESLAQLRARRRLLNSQMMEAAREAEEFEQAHEDLISEMRTSKPGVVDMERVNRMLDNLKTQRKLAGERVIELGKKIKKIDDEIDKKRKQRQRRNPSPRRMLT